MLNLTDFCTLVILRKTLLWHLLGYYWWFFFFMIIMRDPTVASIAALSPLALLEHPSIICRSRTPKNSSGLTFQVLRKGVILANPFWGRMEKNDLPLKYSLSDTNQWPPSVPGTQSLWTCPDHLRERSGLSRILELMVEQQDWSLKWYCWTEQKQ